MVMAKEYNFIKIIGFSLLCLTLWALPIVTMAETNTDSFYGSQSLNSIVDGEKMTLTLPGGAKVAMENQENAYTLPDHTQSTRLAVEADNTVSEPIAYTPFGDSQETNEIKLIGHYTGMTFEPETATYDYHARRYDGASARFTSVDLKREGGSPYVYVGNNPVNFVDPNGLGEVHFLLYSVFGITEADKTGGESLAKNNFQVRMLVKELGLPVKIEPLESDEPIDLLPGDTVRRLTLFLHGGRSQEVSLFDTKNSKKIDTLPWDFADYLHQKLQTRVGVEPIKNLESVCFISCGIADHGRALIPRSFLDFFAEDFKIEFPNLKSVIGSTKTMNIAADIFKKNNLTLQLYVEPPIQKSDPHHMLEYSVDAKKFFEHDLPKELYKPIDPKSVDRLKIRSEYMREMNLYMKTDRTTDLSDISSVVSRNHLEREVFLRRVLTPDLHPSP